LAPTSCLEATGWLAALVMDRDRSPLRSLRLWLSLLVILSMLSMSMSATSDAEGGGVVVTAAGGRNRRAGARQESRGGGERGWSGLEPHQRATKQNKEAGVGIFSGCRCQRLRIAISFLVSVRASLFAPPPLLSLEQRLLLATVPEDVGVCGLRMAHALGPPRVVFVTGVGSFNKSLLLA